MGKQQIPTQPNLRFQCLTVLTGTNGQGSRSLAPTVAPQELGDSSAVKGHFSMLGVNYSSFALLKSLVALQIEGRS
jgi:hypothetical protein